MAFHKGYDGLTFDFIHLVMLGLDPSIQDCRPPLDCRVKPGNDSWAEQGQGLKES